MIDIHPAIQLKVKPSADSSRSRVPLHELQMLTQSVTSRDYVHAYAPITESGDQQKKSPLALLAATCSSIGKTEGKKESREAVINTSRLSPKISSSLNDVRGTVKLNSEEKSSFKPYKQLDEKEVSHNTEKPGFRAPSKDTANDVSSHNKSPEFRNKVSPHIGPGFASFQYPSYLTDPSGHCFYQGSPSSRVCGMYYDMAGHSSSSSHHATCLKPDCNGCNSMVLPSPTSLAPTTPSIRPMFPTPPVSGPSPVKSHGLSPTSARSNPLYPRCNCGYCNQGQESSLKQTLPHLAHYHRNYLTSACQDPYCVNCKTSKTSTSGSSHGCGPQCYGHHHHDSSSLLPSPLPTVPPSMSHLYPYAGFMLRAQNDQNGPFVCNWVQDSKNCGKNFTTSEELLQHLRTHTSTASASSAPLHTPCNIPDCPCGLKSAISGPTRLHSASRYHPYFMPSPALHAPSFHSAISHYTSPHGIPYPSTLKPY